MAKRTGRKALPSLKCKKGVDKMGTFSAAIDEEIKRLLENIKEISRCSDICNTVYEALAETFPDYTFGYNVYRNHSDLYIYYMKRKSDLKKAEAVMLALGFDKVEERVTWAVVQIYKHDAKECEINLTFQTDGSSECKLIKTNIREELTERFDWALECNSEPIAG